MSAAKASGKRLSESDSLKDRRKRIVVDDDDFDAAISKSVFTSPYVADFVYLNFHNIVKKLI